MLTKVKSLGPDALYYGGVMQAGVKVAKQSYDIVPKMIKAGGDGVFGPEMLTAVGFPAAEGWYATNASPHMTENPRAQKFVERFKAKFGEAPDDYAICAYDAGVVIINAVQRLVKANKTIDHASMRDAIQASKVPTVQGIVAFDANGDILDRTVSVFQIKKDPSKPLDDVTAQYHYIGVAPQA